MDEKKGRIKLAERIVRDPEILSGKPIIEGTRIPVELIKELHEAGLSIHEIIEEYPSLTEEDVKAALDFTKDILQKEDNLEKKVKEYIAKYYSVGELRLKLDFVDNTKEIDSILRSLEDKGLIYWDRKSSVITASQKLVNEYKHFY